MIITSNNDEANIEPCSSEEVEAYRQGYTKALDDVKDKFDLFDIPVLKDWIEKEIAKLKEKTK